MIVVGSRYQDGELQPILRMGRDAGTTELSVFRPQPEARGSSSFMFLRAGERWDMISMKSQGDSSRWWSVLDVNDEIIDPFSVTPGTRVKMP